MDWLLLSSYGGGPTIFPPALAARIPTTHIREVGLRVVKSLPLGPPFPLRSPQRAGQQSLSTAAGPLSPREGQRAATSYLSCCLPTGVVKHHLLPASHPRTRLPPPQAPPRLCGSAGCWGHTPQLQRAPVWPPWTAQERHPQGSKKPGTPIQDLGPQESQRSRAWNLRDLKDSVSGCGLSSCQIGGPRSVS